MTIPKGFKAVSQSQPAQQVETASIPAGFKPVAKPVQAQQEAAFNPSVMDFFTGNERIARQPELGTLPEFSAARDELGLTIGLLTTMDEKAQQDIILEHEPNAIFEKTKDGSVIVEIPTEAGGSRRTVLNRPGFSPRDLANSVAQVVSFLPAGKLTALGKSITQKFMLGAAGGSATEQALQEVGMQLGRKERDPTATATAGLLGGFSEVAIPLVKEGVKGVQAKQLQTQKDALQEVIPNISRGEEVAKATGIDLTPAQKTLDAFSVEQQSFLSTLPASARKAVDFLKTQNEQAQAATKEFLSGLAPSDALQVGNVKARDAAKTLIELAKDSRRQATKPLYKKAFEEGALVDFTDINKFVNSQLDTFPASGQVAKSLNKAKKLIEEADSLEGYHNAKVEIDQMLAAKGENSLQNTTKAKLTELRNLLREELENASPMYKEAQEKYAELSVPVDDLIVSKIGQISKITDEKLNNVSKQIFDESITDPEVIKQTRNLIESVDPEAWASVVRIEAQRRLKRLDLDLSELTPDNAPAKIVNQLFGTGNKRELFLESMTASQRENAELLIDALSRASLGRPGGSQTGIRNVVVDRLKGSFRNWVRTPLNQLISTGEDEAFDRSVRSLAELAFNPKWQPRFKKIKAMNPDSPKFAQGVSQLLNDISAEENTSESSDFNEM